MSYFEIVIGVWVIFTLLYLWRRVTVPEVCSCGRKLWTIPGMRYHFTTKHAWEEHK